jgi:hypothetical protein
MEFGSHGRARTGSNARLSPASRSRPLLLAGIRPVQFLSCCWYDDAARRSPYDTAEGVHLFFLASRKLESLRGSTIPTLVPWNTCCGGSRRFFIPFGYYLKKKLLLTCTQLSIYPAA